MKRAVVFATVIWAGEAFACADFSGKWKGTCVESGQNEAVELELAQAGCTAITIDGAALPIGQTTTTTSTDQGVTSTIKRTPAWDSAQNVLTETVNIVDTQGGRNVFQLDATTTYALQGGKLVSAVNETGRAPGQSPTTRQVSCTFDKQ